MRAAALARYTPQYQSIKEMYNLFIRSSKNSDSGDRGAIGLQMQICLKRAAGIAPAADPLIALARNVNNFLGLSHNFLQFSFVNCMLFN